MGIKEVFHALSSERTQNARRKSGGWDMGVKRNLRTVTINKIEMRMIQQPVGKKRGPATR